MSVFENGAEGQNSGCEDLVVLSSFFFRFGHLDAPSKQYGTVLLFLCPPSFSNTTHWVNCAPSPSITVHSEAVETCVFVETPVVGHFNRQCSGVKLPTGPTGLGLIES